MKNSNYVLHHMISKNFKASFIASALSAFIRFGSFGDIIKRHFAPTLSKLNFYVDYVVGFFVESITTVSTFALHGNISTQHARSTRYPRSCRNVRSRARLVGLQEI